MDVRLVRAAVATLILGLPGASFADAGAEGPVSTVELAQAGSTGDQASPTDINSASEDELRTLPGIGPARAGAIVSGRPYAGKDDLVKRNIIPKNVYEGIRDRIAVKRH